MCGAPPSWACSRCIISTLAPCAMQVRATAVIAIHQNPECLQRGGTSHQVFQAELCMLSFRVLGVMCLNFGAGAHLTGVIQQPKT